ncbi:MAG: S8 family serine peptidase [Solirubrobacteraceae bacterium]
MDTIVILEDWYADLVANQEVAAIAQAAVQSLSERFGDARFYEFLPVGTLSVDKPSDHQEIVKVPGVRYVMEAGRAFQTARQFYGQAMSALSAIRSQTGYQRWEWFNALREGRTFPNNDWCGGLWPAQPYPTLALATAELTRADSAVVRKAAPAFIPVLSLSIGPPHALPVELNDPLVYALASMSKTHLVVTAAGNYGPDASSMNPWAVVPGVFSVGALEASGCLWPRSSRGSADGAMRGPDVVADGTLTELDDVGTSYSAPRVATLGLICIALLAQLDCVLGEVLGYGEEGVACQALSLVDLPAATIALEQDSLIPFVGLPALPLVGPRRDVVGEAFADLAAEISRRGCDSPLDWTFQSTAVATDIIRGAARHLPGYDPSEVGSGVVSEELLLDHLGAARIADVFSWFGIDRLVPERIGNELAFDRTALEQLALVVKLSRPLYVWDMRNRTFVLGRSLDVGGGALAALRSRALAVTDTSGGGHMSRVARSTLA